MKRRSFARKPPKKTYKKMFIIAAEGSKTEPQYFNGMFRSLNAVINVKVLKNNTHSSPRHVLKKMKKYLSEENFKDIDEAWFVVDKDKWTDTQLNELNEWSKKEDKYGFALSNPKFEYSLLLHFEDAKGVSTSQKVSERLKKHLPNYDKSVDVGKLEGKLDDAIRRAKQKDNPPCSAWPKSAGTTVYKLAENILKAGQAR